MHSGQKLPCVRFDWTLLSLTCFRIREGIVRRRTLIEVSMISLFYEKRDVSFVSGYTFVLGAEGRHEAARNHDATSDGYGGFPTIVIGNVGTLLSREHVNIKT